MGLGVTLCVMLSVLSWTEAYYFPARAPTNFCTRELALKHAKGTCTSRVFVHVNKLDSTQNLVPYEYGSFDFCEVGKESDDEDPVENLGQVVMGERLRASAYNVIYNMSFFDHRQRIMCTKMYTSKGSSQKKLNFFRDRIHEGYMQQWVIDNMPVTWCYKILVSDKPFCTSRFPVGCYVTDEGLRDNACFLSDELSVKGETYLFNMVELILYYHKGTEPENTDGRLVRAQVRLRSCQDMRCSDPMVIDSPSLRERFKDEEFTLTVSYMYTVQFIEAEDIKWASRWDYILDSMSSTNLQWLSLFNSLLFTFFLTAVVIFRTIYPEGFFCKRYMNTQEDVGWKLIDGDVFRPPPCAMLLSVCVGSGVQLLVVTSVCLVFACLGVLSPPNRGYLMTSALVLYVATGCLAGYVSVRLYKMMGGLWLKSSAIVTAFLVPGVCFTVFFSLNHLLWREGSSAAVPSTTLLTLLCLWFGVSLPLTVFGAFLGFWRPPIEQPVNTNQIPREIPWWPCQVSLRKWLSQSVPSSLSWGFFTFVCVWLQVYFILNDIWGGHMYYMFGFLSVAFFLLVLVCAQSSILCCYGHLCAEDYRWWWRPFFTAGTSALYLFLLSLHYFVYNTSIAGGLSYLIFFGYTFVMVFLFWVTTGAIGFVACLVYVRKLYSTLKMTAEITE